MAVAVAGRSVGEDGHREEIGWAAHHYSRIRSTSVAEMSRVW